MSALQSSQRRKELAKDGEETADCYGKVALAEPMVGLDFDALRAGEAPESFLCDL
jgi:hypothetical protein